MFKGTIGQNQSQGDFHGYKDLLGLVFSLDDSCGLQPPGISVDFSADPRRMSRALLIMTGELEELKAEVGSGAVG